jgi:hypothetical protein
LKKCSPSLVVKKMYIKTKLRFYLTLVRIAIIKNTTNDKCWWGCGEKGTLMHCWWECKIVQPLWKTVWRLFKKLIIDLSYDLAIPLLEIHLKECNSGYYKGTCLLQHYSQQPSYGNRQDAPLLTNGLRTCGIYTQWTFTHP